MPRKSLPIDADDVCRRYMSGESMQQISRVYRCRTDRISEILRSRGIPIRRQTKEVPTDRIVERYLAGESEKALAAEYGIVRSAVRRYLLSAGVTPRNRSEGMYARMAQTSPEQRQALSAKAHDAVRGRKATVEERSKTAKTREERQTHTSPAELIVQRWLADRGIDSIPQKAIGPYNADIAADPVAVEIFGGYWHGYGGHRIRASDRFRYLFDEGWAVLIIWVDRRNFPLRQGAADYAASLIEQTRLDPSMRGKYWVIRGDGKVVSAGESDIDKIADIPSFRRRNRLRPAA